MKDLQKGCLFYQNGTNVYKRLRGNAPDPASSTSRFSFIQGEEEEEDALFVCQVRI